MRGSPLYASVVSFWAVLAGTDAAAVLPALDEPRLAAALAAPAAHPAVLAAFLVALLGAVALAGPASAHGGPGKLVVVSTEPQAEGTSVKVTVQLNFAGDGDPAADATVTVVGELDGGGTAP